MKPARRIRIRLAVGRSIPEREMLVLRPGRGFEVSAQVGTAPSGHRFVYAVVRASARAVEAAETMERR